jgi:hypothetical protein
MKKLMTISAVFMAAFLAGTPLYAVKTMFIQIDNRLDEQVTVTPLASSCWFRTFNTTVIAPKSRVTIGTEGGNYWACLDKPILLAFRIFSANIRNFDHVYRLEYVREIWKGYWLLSGWGVSTKGYKDSPGADLTFDLVVE